MGFGKTKKNTSNNASVATSGRSVIGVDISQNNIRMVQVSGRQLSQVQLEKYAILPLPQNVVLGHEINDYEQFVSILQQCYEKLKTNCKQANIALPTGSVTIEENLVFSKNNEEELSLQEFVEVTVSQIGDLDEMNYDWQILSEQGNDQNILMVAAKTEAVDKCSDLLDEIGITASNVDVDLFAIANAFIFADAKEGGEFAHERIAVFDVSDISLKALIMEGSRILYKQESNFGLEQLVQLIQRNYQVPDDEALAMIFGEAARPKDYKELITDSFNMQIAQEVQRTMQFFYATQSMDSGSDVKHIFISGSGCTPNSGVAEVIYSQTNIPTQQLNPILLATNKTKIEEEQLNKDASSLTTAFGLALRGLI
ncbi:type IV pilus assembly protein PilM [Kingella negevensis]|uniref:Competence protein A n=1 Tax=Kingella negevensis TaxID=1522312 RepID=A0A238T9Q0_9NEIS|nr:type IV pilus assembly protein PilM [Kingella negevensis]MDK4679949.1 type IV pilus assembly protein PilM [Kingella negevensis]MDK4682332.1 type IV pilus assembly protein PilM [Kingella negevensis]MDK4684584.1 type IV pilus assembly protein PilM [Kingella negevensis]MDK4690529.1 type IV pilus assembly protein PilM [Kingella negevensis]MDK4692123.1 type IV pilus assembly protein PilM [Kingella negevensis]